MLDLLRASDKSNTIALTSDFTRDLNWFCQFTKVFNGTAFFHHTHHHGRIELDASLQGLGANFNNEVYAIPIVKNLKQFGIVHLEMLNIMVAIRVWAHQWSGKTIVIACDNQAVVSILNSGRTRDMTLAAIACNIAMESAMADINLRVIHILGKQNADSLSRYHMAEHHRNRVHEILPNASFLFPDPFVLDHIISSFHRYLQIPYSCRQGSVEAPWCIQTLHIEVIYCHVPHFHCILHFC